MLEVLRRELFRCQARALWLRSLAVSDPLLSARLQAESSLAFLRATQGECPLDSLSGHPEAASDISESGGSALPPCHRSSSSHVSPQGGNQKLPAGSSSSHSIRATS